MILRHGVTMMRYDPLNAPDPKEWLSLDEQERLDLVEDYHRRARIDLPNEKVHAVAHAVVENQIALGEELNVERTLRRLMAEGLDRHDAIHAIGMVCFELLHGVFRDPKSKAFPKEEYAAALDRLTAEDWRRSADEPETEDVDEATFGEREAFRILDVLAAAKGLPVEAIRTADAHRTDMAPLFIELIEQYLAGKTERSLGNALFFIFHMLGSWHEKSAYPSLAKLLRRPADEIEDIFSDSTTETSHRVMAAVFDGDPKALYDVIHDPQANEYIRSRMCEVLAMLTLRGELPRAEAERFLRACYSDFEPQVDCFVWNGWQSAIAALGLIELKPLVEQAFKRGYIDPSWVRLEHFEKDLQRAIEHPTAPWRRENEYTLFGDTIEELSKWTAFSPDKGRDDEDNFIDRERQWSPTVPAVNPFKNVGRNDPCPCGSGKKFKKCCLS
jgi:uncharacterized protein